MNRKLVLAALVLALGALSAGIAIAAGGGGDSQPESPATVSENLQDDGVGEGKDDEGAGEAEDSDAASEGKEDDGAGEAKDEGAGEAGDTEESLTGSPAKKAADAALAATGGGTVVGVESDDGDAAYEVEIRKADGSEVEVHVDGSFKVRGSPGGDD